MTIFETRRFGYRRPKDDVFKTVSFRVMILNSRRVEITEVCNVCKHRLHATSVHVGSVANCGVFIIETDEAGCNPARYKSVMGSERSSIMKFGTRLD